MSVAKSMSGVYLDSGATFCRERIYRYALWRRWREGEDYMAVIGLNPSTADEGKDDATIRRCVGYAKREGYGGLVMLNMFGLRSTNPKGLWKVIDPVGADNDFTIKLWTVKAGLVVVACGAHVTHTRLAKVGAMLTEICGERLKALGFTKGGIPKHPLYLKADAPLLGLSFEIRKAS